MKIIRICRSIYPHLSLEISSDLEYCFVNLQILNLVCGADRDDRHSLIDVIGALVAAISFIVGLVIYHSVASISSI